MASYYDRVLEDFDLREGVLDEGIYDEGILDEGVYDESYDEGFDEARRRRRPVRVAPSVNRPANFGRGINTANRNYVTKSELRSSLDSISSQVNDLKKSSLSIAASLKRVDDGYERVVRSIAKKDRSQDNLANNSTMTALMSTLVNKPTLNPAALEVDGGAIKVRDGQDPIQVDLTKTMLFTLMPTLMNGGDKNMMLPLMVILLTQKQGVTNTNDNTLLLALPLMMMGMSNNRS